MKNTVPLKVYYLYNVRGKENIFDVMIKNKNRNFEEIVLLKYLDTFSKNTIEN